MVLGAQKLSYGLRFQNSLADASIFFICAHGVTLYILVYVNDIIITGSSLAKVQALNTSLYNRFSLKDHGDLSYFFGIEVTRSSHGLHLCQRKYIIDLLLRYHMSDAKPVPTTMCSSLSLSISDGVTLDDATEYITVVGSLNTYLSHVPTLPFL